jgi:RNA polymerase-binding transcription factor DksA
MKHLTEADRHALAQRLEVMKLKARDEICSTTDDVAENVQPAAHEVRSQADDAEVERLGDVRFAEIEIDRIRLHDIEEAEKRMAEGRYGICEACGEEIPRDRLLAQPIAIRCAACQSAIESRPRR